MTADGASPVEAECDRINRLQEEFRVLHRLGLHLYPVGADKLPVGKWAHGSVNYVEQRATVALGDDWAKDPRVRGWANLCGARDVKVFTIDVEAAGMDYPQVSGVLDNLPSFCQRPSPSGGRHAVVRITDGDPIVTESLAFGGGRLLVEVRGVSREDGHYGAYAVITGPGRGPLPHDFAPAELTRAEADRLLDMARNADDGSRPRKACKDKPPKVPREPGEARGGGTGQVLAEAVGSGVLAWPDLLDAGWAVTSEWNGRIGLIRPPYGQPSSAGESANARDGVLVVHSESVPWAVTGEGYNAPQALAAARFGGDYAVAMKAVEDGSDGTPPQFMSTWPTIVLEAVRASRAAGLTAFKAKEEKAISEWIEGLEEAPMGTTTAERAPQADSLDATPARRLQLVSFADITERAIDWLVPGLIPRAEVVIALGQEGIGKGLWWCHLISRVTTGPDAIDVVVIVAEDSPDATVLPRLKAAGADLGRIHLITMDPETYTGVPTIPGHSTQVAGLIRDAGASLVIVDPWLSIVPGALRVSDTQQARQALDPVTRLARETGAAFVLVTHTNRMASTKARDLYGATVALRQAGRVCVMAVQDPGDETVLYVGVEKSNIIVPVPADKYIKVGTIGTAAWKLADTGEHVGLTIGELVDLFAQADDRRATDKWTEVAVVAAQTGGVITRSHIVDVYSDATDPGKAADKAINRWKNTDPPRLMPVKGQRGVFKVTGIGLPPATPRYPPTPDMGGMGGRADESPRTPRKTNGGLAGGSGGIASRDDPSMTVAASVDHQMEMPA